MFGTTLVLTFMLSCADMPFAPGGKDGDSAGTGGPRHAANSVLLVSPEEDTLATGDSLQLSSLDGNGKRISATWSSSDPRIASVSKAGLVTAVAAGSATITAKVRQSQASASIEVIEAAEPPSEPEPPPSDSTPPPSDSTPPASSDTVTSPPPPSDTAPAATVNVYPDQGASGLIRAVNNATSGAVIRVHGPHTYDIGTTELRPPVGNVQIWGDPVTRGPNGEVYAPTKIVGSGNNVFRLTHRHDITLARLDMSGGKWIGSEDPSGQTGNVILTHNERTRVLFSKVHGGENTGLSGQGVDLTIEDSELTGNGFSSASGIMAAVKITRSLIVRRSYVHHNPRHGLWTDCNAWTLIVEDSRIEYNGRNGIFYEISTGPSLVRRNIIRFNNPAGTGARGGIAIHSSKDLVVEQNTFEQNGRAAVYLYEDSRAGVTEGGSCSRGYYLSGVVIRDNRLNGGAVVNAHLATLSGNK